MGCTNSGGQIAGNQTLHEELEYQLNGPKLADKAFNKTAQSSGLVDFQNVSDEQFMATKPWIGALVAPTSKPSVNPSPPQATLTLQFINGWKVEDSRQNIFWTNRPNIIVYPAAAVGVTMDVNSLKQKFLGAGDAKKATAHTDDIMALGVSPDRKWVVTGSLGAQPDILVWNSETMEVKGRTKLGRNTRAVSTIRFSKNGKFFFCSDKHNDSNVYCYEVQTMKLVGTEKCGSDPVIDAETGNQNRFACATKSGVWFFQCNNGIMSKNRCIFGNNPRTAMSAVTYSQDDSCFLSGSVDGFIFYWNQQDYTCTKVRQTHQGSIMALQWAEGSIYSSGATDKTLKVSSYDGAILKTFQLPSYAKSIDALNKKILVGTKCGRILTIDGDNKKEVMHGHWTGEAWGLAVAQNGLVYTTGDDNTILTFNPKTSRVEKQATINPVAGKKYKIGGASTLSLLPPNQQARALAVNKTGHIAVGVNDGTLTIRDVNNINTEIFKTHQAKQWIEVIKYSPDQKYLAVGSHDNNIYIYTVSGSQYAFKGALKGHNSFITQLDWSRDSKNMQSVCGAYELLFWDVDKLAQITSGGTQFRDEKWATYTCKLGWWVQGVFPPGTDGSHVNGLERSKNQKVIATADDWGLVNLYRNPCMNGAKSNSYRAHSSHVVRALFDSSDQYLYSIGGYDKTLMVWKVN